VNVISKPNLFEAARATGNSQLAEKVARWYELATKNNFANFVELQRVFPSVDLTGDKLAFNLGSYRLICGVSFLRKTLFFKALLSHAAYEQGGWKKS
jgi:mRNA interferase HigB